ncbi:hypothetical protein JCM8097_001313 [Rhodosporidiobolus ruineniae]
MEADRFIQPLPDYLTCPVCLEAAWEPWLSCAAEHLLCTACWSNVYYSPRQECPECRAPLLLPSKRSEVTRRALDSLRIRCKEPRCKWNGTITQESEHRTNTCNFRLVECADCRQEYVNADQAQHQAVCPEACTVTPGCPTRTTLPNRPPHEKECAKVHHRVCNLEKELETVNGKLNRLKLAASFSSSSGAASTSGSHSSSRSSLLGPFSPKRRTRASQRNLVDLTGSEDEAARFAAPSESPEDGNSVSNSLEQQTTQPKRKRKKRD